MYSSPKHFLNNTLSCIEHKIWLNLAGVIPIFTNNYMSTKEIQTA